MAAKSQRETDKEMEELLVDIGLQKKVARTLIYLSHVEETISEQIERGTSLRQPEVSIALKELREMGWIEKKDVKKEGKGRPVHHYKMVVPMNKAINTLVKKKRNDIERMQENIKKLKALSTTRSEKKEGIP